MGATDVVERFPDRMAAHDSDAVAGDEMRVHRVVAEPTEPVGLDGRRRIRRVAVYAQRLAREDPR